MVLPSNYKASPPCFTVTNVNNSTFIYADNSQQNNHANSSAVEQADECFWRRGGMGILVLQQICGRQNKTGPIMGQNVSYDGAGSNLWTVKKKKHHRGHLSIMPTKAASMAVSPGKSNYFWLFCVREIVRPYWAASSLRTTEVWNQC